MSLGSIPIAFLVPPENLFWPCAVGLALAARRVRFGSGLLIFSIAGLFMLSLPFVSQSLLASLEVGLPLQTSASDPPAAIVILSGDIEHGDGSLEPGSLTLERERAGAALHRSTGLPILVTGGLVGKTGETLAGVMARSLQDDFRVQTRWQETRAQDTMENGIYSAQILKVAGIHSVYLVTHAWHMKRTILGFQRAGFAVTASPVRLDRQSKFNLTDFFPNAKATLDSYYALHEWIGYLADLFPLTAQN